MRVAFFPPTISQFERLFAAQRGAGLDDIRIYTHNRGSGILSFLAGMAKKAIPFLMRTVFPEGLSLAQGVLQDVNTGRNVRDSLKDRGIDSIKNIGRKIVGGKRMLKRLQNKKTVMKKKKRLNDIFASL